MLKTDAAFCRGDVGFDIRLKKMNVIRSKQHRLILIAEIFTSPNRTLADDRNWSGAAPAATEIIAT